MVALRTFSAALITAAVLACSKERSSSEASSTSVATDGSTANLTEQTLSAAAPAAAPPMERMAMRDEGIAGGAAAAGKVAGEAVPTAPPAPSQAGFPGTQGTSVDPTAAGSSMIIRTGIATLQVDSLELAIARVQQVVQGITGAYVANTSIESGDKQVRRASVEIKVPAAQFDRVVTGVRAIGKVEGVNVAAQDVTEEFVDIQARVENSRRLESRLIDLLANRTGKLSDVLTVERELARVREEIERYEGRLRFLRTRSAISTLTVALHEPLPVLGDAAVARNPIAEAFRQSWRNFVGFVAGFISITGVLVPVGVLAYLLWLGVRRIRRTYFASPAAPVAPVAPPASGD